MRQKSQSTGSSSASLDDVPAATLIKGATSWRPTLRNCPAMRRTSKAAWYNGDYAARALMSGKVRLDLLGVVGSTRLACRADHGAVADGDVGEIPPQPDRLSRLG